MARVVQFYRLVPYRWKHRRTVVVLPPKAAPKCRFIFRRSRPECGNTKVASIQSAYGFKAELNRRSVNALGMKTFFVFGSCERKASEAPPRSGELSTVMANGRRPV
jgi:hypothetical protein